MRIKSLLLVILCNLLFLAPLAAEETGDDQESIDAARELFEKGAKFFKNGQFFEAAAAFREAYKTQANWKICYNIAQSEAAAKRHGLALTAFEEYLSLGGDDIPEQRREAVVKEIERLKSVVGFISVEAPDNATLDIDGVNHGTTPLEGLIPLSVGVTHTVQITLEDGVTQHTKNVRLISGSTTYVNFHQRENDSPAKAEAQPEPEPAAEPAPPVESKRASKPLLIAAWTTLGVGVAALIGGAVTGGMVLAANDDIDKKCPDGCYETEYHLLDRRDNLALSTDVLLIGGGVVAVAGGVMLFFALRNKGKKGRKTAFANAKVDANIRGTSIEIRF